MIKLNGNRNTTYSHRDILIKSSAVENGGYFLFIGNEPLTLTNKDGRERTAWFETLTEARKHIDAVLGEIK